MENLTWSDVYKPVHEFIYTQTEAAIWVAFVFLLLLFYIVSSVQLIRFLVTLATFAIVAYVGLHYLEYLHANP